MVSSTGKGRRVGSQPLHSIGNKDHNLKLLHWSVSHHLVLESEHYPYSIGGIHVSVESESINFHQFVRTLAHFKRVQRSCTQDEHQREARLWVTFDQSLRSWRFASTILTEQLCSRCMTLIEMAIYLKMTWDMWVMYPCWLCDCTLCVVVSWTNLTLGRQWCS